MYKDIVNGRTLNSTLIIKLLLSQKWMCTQTNKYNYNITFIIFYAKF